MSCMATTHLSLIKSMKMSNCDLIFLLLRLYHDFEYHGITFFPETPPKLKIGLTFLKNSEPPNIRHYRQKYSSLTDNFYDILILSLVKKYRIRENLKYCPMRAPTLIFSKNESSDQKKIKVTFLQVIWQSTFLFQHTF